ncbi:hypothetical protein [Microcystis aeruginosa]|uniref:hypothetical protein n=1 Tax=Microcystis aeruginosa TaxID=1126 RepID=UPI000AF88301|nr:hypothetical protein [Microcystis aeruginosa]
MLVGLGDRRLRDRRQESVFRRQETGVSIQETGDSETGVSFFLPAPFPPLPYLPTPLSPPATRTKWSPHSPRLFKQDLV